jgi:hypothetical protein
MLVTLYRNIVSQDIRDKIYDIFLGDLLVFFRNFSESMKAKLYFIFQWFLPKTEKNSCYAFMGRYGLMPIPYPFVLKYKKRPIDICFDESKQMYYVVHGGKKLYFPNTKRRMEIINQYRALISEQDTLSPHCYLKNTDRLKGKILLDVGAAEGIFTLNCIEELKSAYLFECEKEWIEALNATFAPFIDKITLIPKYVSDIDDKENITLDKFFEDKNTGNLFLKMDIEGYEQAALRGSIGLLQNAENFDFSICTYHKKNDATEIAKMLDSFNYEYEQTDGYFYYRLEKDLRKAIIRKK